MTANEQRGALALAEPRAPDPCYTRTWDRVVFRGNPASREFIAFWLRNGRVVAGMNINVWDVTDPIKRLISGRGEVDERRLADPEVPLEELAPAEDGVA